MPKKQPTPKRVRNAASVKVSIPNLMITQAMRATGQFSKEECKHRGLQIAIQWYCNEIASTEIPPAYIAHPTANSNNEPVTFSLTPSSFTLFQPSMPENFMANASASRDPSVSHPPKPKRNSKFPLGAKEIQKTSLQTQQHRVNNKKKMMQKRKQ